MSSSPKPIPGRRWPNEIRKFRQQSLLTLSVDRSTSIYLNQTLPSGIPRGFGACSESLRRILERVEENLCAVSSGNDDIDVSVGVEIGRANLEIDSAKTRCADLKIALVT